MLVIAKAEVGALLNFSAPRSPVDSYSRGWSALPSTKSLPCPGAIHDNRNVNVAAEEKAKTNLFLFSQQSYTQGNILCLVLFLTQCVYSTRHFWMYLSRYAHFIVKCMQYCFTSQKSTLCIALYCCAMCIVDEQMELCTIISFKCDFINFH